MSFLDSLFGGKAKNRDLASANRSATAALDNSIAAQRAALSQGTTTAIGNINSGYDTARSDITGGYANARDAIGSGYDTARSDITGGITSARSAIGSGFDTARGDITTNYGNAEGAINAGMDRARGLMNPLVESGKQYNAMLADALGANGAGARTAFYDNNVRNNNDFAFADQLAAKQLQAKLNASGVTGGRAGALQLRQGAQRIEDRTNQYLDRITQQGARGDQAATTLAGMETGAGTQLAGIRTRLGDRLSNLETNRGTALGGLDMQGAGLLASNATARGTALGNVDMQGANALSNNAVGRSTALAAVNQGNAQQLANVEGNYGTNTAGNAINYGNALSATRGQGLNTMLQLAGLAIRAGTPGTNGVSPFGNMRDGTNSLWGRA